MGQCVLKDCGFEYQKTKVENGVPFAEFFKEKIRAKKAAKLSSIDEKTTENETRIKEKDPNETTKIHNFLTPKYNDKKSRPLNVHDDMIIDITHTKYQEQVEKIDVRTPEKRFAAFKKPEGKISELGSQNPHRNKQPKVRRLNMGKIPSQNFTPLLDSLRDSLDKSLSPYQSKVSLNEKYEKSSLFKAAQTNFQNTNNDMEQSEDGSDMYENIFSDADSSVGGQKTSGFYIPEKNNINSSGDPKLKLKSMNFKLEFNNDIHVLSQKPASLFDLKNQIRDLYDDLKKVENFKIQYKDKDDFMMTIQNEQDYAFAVQTAKEIEKPSFKLFILPDHANSQFGLINTNFNLKTPSTTSEFVPTGRPRFFPYDTSNTTSSDEKLTGRESFMPDQDREKAAKSSGDVNIQEKNKGNPFKIEGIEFIRMEEEKFLKYSVENNKEDIKNELNEKKTKKKMEFISSPNAFNRLEKFTSVKCYKCKGKGLNPSKNNKKCKKCKGTGDFSNSVKSSVIDYFIKEKLGNIYKEFELKLSQSDPYKSKFFASETTNNTYNNTNSSFGICTQCGVNIDGPHKFKCSKCPLLTLCDKCEKSFDHPHSLTKVKRSVEENKLNFSKSVQLNYPFSSTDSSQLNKSINKKAFESLDPVQSKLTSSTSTPYKAKFFNEHFTEKVPLGAQFTMFFTIQNNGDGKWPDSMEFICISGYFQGTSVAVPSLEIGDKYTVNLNLIAPKKEETLSSSWRLAYVNKNDKKFFGPKINSTVLAMKPEKMVLKESAKDAKEVKKKFVSH